MQVPEEGRRIVGSRTSILDEWNIRVEYRERLLKLIGDIAYVLHLYFNHL